jgi:prolyl oligopeptidase
MRRDVRAVFACGLVAAAIGGGCDRARETYQPQVQPPTTRTAPVTETLHGVTLTDEYRWLEGTSDLEGSPPGQPGEIATWTEAQRRYARAVLDGVPGRADIEARLAALVDAGDLSLPLVSGNRFFFWQRFPGEALPTVYTRDGALGADRALIRPADLAAGGFTAAQWIMPSPDGRLLAFGTARAGDRDGTLRLLDVDTARPLALEIGGSPHSVYWLPDSTGFIYQRLASPDDPTSNVVLFHQLGRNPAADLMLHRQYTRAENAELAATRGPFAALSRDGRWLVAGYWTSPSSNDLWLVSFDDIRRGRRVAPRLATLGSPGHAIGTAIGHTLFIETTKGAPNGRVVAVDASNPVQARWRDVVPERADAVIERVTFGRNVIAVTYLKQASNVTEVFDHAGRTIGIVAQPGIGTTALAARDDGDDAFLAFSSFNRPQTILRVNLQSPAVRGSQWKASAAPVEPESIAVEQVRYPSKDGTPVSMFLVRKKDVAPNGALPTLLVGYGAFGVAMTPTYTAHWLQWFEAGGLLAVPHVRGGGEYGPAWHAAGARNRKTASFDDFVAAAEWLIANRYTEPAKLAMFGDAAGGLLAGGALVSRPDLFRAAVLIDPLLDMLRYDRFLQGPGWRPEFGAPAEREAFGWLRSYSPYHRVTRGARYPAVLLTGSERARAVHPMHARKMAARLQAATNAAPHEQPVLLQIGESDDAGGGGTRELRALVDQRVFLMWQLGML